MQSSKNYKQHYIRYHRYILMLRPNFMLTAEFEHKFYDPFFYVQNFHFRSEFYFIKTISNKSRENYKIFIRSKNWITDFFWCDRKFYPKIPAPKLSAPIFRSDKNFIIFSILVWDSFYSKIKVLHVEKLIVKFIFKFCRNTYKSHWSFLEI